VDLVLNALLFLQHLLSSATPALVVRDMPASALVALPEAVLAAQPMLVGAFLVWCLVDR